MRVFIIIFVFILSGCSITHEIPKCELMLRGEECLSDHRCCNPPRTHYQSRQHWNWWYWNKPTYTKTIVIQNNKPNKPNKPNRPNRKPKNKKR